MTAPPRSFRLGAAWICIAALAVLSLLPKEHMVRTSLGGRLEHILAYAGTALVVASTYASRTNIALGLIAYAGVLEWLQRFSPGRTSAVADFVFSATGVLMGLALIAIAERIGPLKRGA